VTDEGRDSDGLLSLLAGIGVGVLVGSMVALLLAPQTGEQTRAQLKESADDALGRLRDSMDDLRTKVEEMASKAGAAVPGRAGQPGGPDALQGGVSGPTDETQPPAV
jgi:hypothetical protein